MLELKNISKAYRNKKGKVLKQVVKNANLQVDRGEFVTILGNGGTSKFALLNLIGGMERFDEGGEIKCGSFSSKNKKIRNWDDFRNFKVAALYPNIHLMDYLDALDNVYLALCFQRMSYYKGRKLAIDKLTKLGLGKELKTLPKDLSSFEKQKVALARALVKNPEIVLCGDPCAELDSKETEEFMKYLKDECKDKSVIFATQDEKLAKKYSTRILELEDGELKESKIVPGCKAEKVTAKDLDSAIVASDANGKSSKAKAPKKEHRALAVTGACKMALESIRRKKGRYILAVLAGAIGVIGVALTLSINTGLNQYIKTAQDTIYAQHPIVFDQARDLSQIDSYAAEEEKMAKEKENAQEKNAAAKEEAAEQNKVALRNVLGTLLSTSGTNSTKNNLRANNDIASLKKHLDTNPQDINSCVSDMEYAYRTTPIIYADNVNGIKEVYPHSGLFGSIGTGSGENSGTALSTSRATASSYGGLNKAFQNIGALPADQSIYRDDDCLKAGHWPETPYECLLVLTYDGKIDDTLLYTLGMRNFKEDIEPLLEKYAKGEKVDFPGQTATFEYKEFLGKKLKMINPSDCYQYNSSQGVWVDKSSDSEYMKNVVNNGKDMEIVGVVQPKLTSVTHLLNKGIQYPYQMNEESIKQTQNAKIVEDQMNNPKKDVLTGETFEYLTNANTIFQRFNFKNLINFRPEMIVGSIKIHPEALKIELPKKKELTDSETVQVLFKLIKSKEFQEFMIDLTKEGKFDEDVYKITANAAAKYFEYVKMCENEGTEPKSAEEWFAFPNEGYLYIAKATVSYPKDLIQDARAFIGKYAPKVVDKFLKLMSKEIQDVFTTVVEQLTDENRPSFIEFDADKFSKALQINLTMDDIKQMGYFLAGDSSRTYESNLSDFGYADLNDPISLVIYPKDYASKKTVLSVIEDYNANARLNDENKVVTYSDDATVGLDIATKAVNAISSFITGLISVSSISTVIMIGVILGVTCAQRRRETGILRSLGGRRHDVTKLYNIESIIIGLFIGLVGVGVTLLINSVINSGLDQELAVLPFGTAAMMVGISMLATLIAGLVPVTIASHKEPSSALQ